MLTGERPEDHSITWNSNQTEAHSTVAIPTLSLAASTDGVAMGAAGSDVALEAADIALMGDDLGKLADGIELSRRALSIIKQNIAFS